MKIKIINSGSNGNSTIVSDSTGNCIVLDCGLSYETIVANTNMSKLDFAIVTHTHGDHTKSLSHFKKFYIETYTWENVTDGKPIETSHWKIMPMELVHNVKCFGFLIYSKIDNKTIAYMTDTSMLRKVSDKTDLIIADTNYDEDIVQSKIENGEQFNRGCFNHMSVQKVSAYIQQLGFIPKNFCAFHLSNSSLIDVKKVEETLSPLVENLIIAKPNTEIIL